MISWTTEEETRRWNDGGFQIKHLGQIKWEKRSAELDLWTLSKKVEKLKRILKTK